ncbi:hypothetical protein HPB48_026113 [Haemaphysalis longicornis]|uniref:Uncharacterized protein n=1 Tax=Haemaphysalis longicornis TaxID=44386 RepID=A0A9J6H8R5_HAELO|nr:hypothetical protein HPB48_026113 [Haemaphysalis longicornis]
MRCRSELDLLPRHPPQTVEKVTNIRDSSRIFNDYDVQVCHVPTGKLGEQLVHPKDALERERFPGMLYIFCPTYVVPCIGETGNFKRQLEEHKNYVANGRTQLSALAEHHDINGHVIALDSARIIATEKIK